MTDHPAEGPPPGALPVVYSDDQAALVDAARAFARDEIAPAAAALDETSSFPAALVDSARRLGLMNLIQETVYGGTGLSVLDACLVVEELAAGCAGVATSLVANDLALTPLRLGASAEQKERFVRPIIEKGLSSFCLTEPDAGSDAAGLRSLLVPDGDGYRLTGGKQWITNGGHADQYTVFATVDPNLRHKGIACVVVPADAPGVTRGRHENKMGQRCSDTVRVSFDGVHVPSSHVVGAPGEGFKLAMKTLDWSRPITAAIAVGVARAATEASVAYARTRKQFGKPIGSFQAVQAMIADMATDLDAARLLTHRSAVLVDAGLPSTTESSMAKRFAADAAMRITTDAVQVHGGYGYVKDYPVEKYMRDAKLTQIYEGTSQIQRVVIARGVLGDL